MSSNELDTVVINDDVAEHGLKAGDLGTVVHRYKDGAAFEVEFVTASGRTIAVLTLPAEQVRPVAETEIFHVRALAPA